MNTKALLIVLSVFLGLSSCRSIKGPDSDSKPVSHAIWDSLLQAHVSDIGTIDYLGFIRDSSRFNDYLDILESAFPNKKNWTPDERKAYWINAYNAYTVQVIIRNYPVESIKDVKGGIAFVNSIWDKKFIEIEGVKMDLNNIEHNILRKEFDDARVHFAIVCASYSCPRLLNEAYDAEKLDSQLDRQARNFINDDRKNVISQDELKLSMIFNWYSGDFSNKGGSVKDYIQQYADTEFDDKAKVSYMSYDWSLNNKD